MNKKWTWLIKNLGEVGQTLYVISPSGMAVYKEKRDGWSWSGNCPEIVEQVVRENGGEIANIERHDEFG